MGLVVLADDDHPRFPDGCFLGLEVDEGEDDQEVAHAALVRGRSVQGDLPGSLWPEVDQTTPLVKAVKVSADGLEARITVPEIKPGHVYEFDLGTLIDAKGETLLHHRAYYTVNEIPAGG